MEGLLEKKEKIEEGERVGVGDGRESLAVPVEIFGRRTEEVLLEWEGEMVITPSRTP